MGNVALQGILPVLIQCNIATNTIYVSVQLAFYPGSSQGTDQPSLGLVDIVSPLILGGEGDFRVYSVAQCQGDFALYDGVRRSFQSFSVLAPGICQDF